jgi:hypothetical protein
MWEMLENYRSVRKIGPNWQHPRKKIDYQSLCASLGGPKSDQHRLL